MNTLSEPSASEKIGCYQTGVENESELTQITRNKADAREQFRKNPVFHIGETGDKYENTKQEAPQKQCYLSN